MVEHELDSRFDAMVATLSAIAPLPASETEYLRRHVTPGRYRPGETLLQIGDVATHCWYLGDGFLRFHYVAEDGREFNKAFCRPGEIVVPLTSMVTGEPSQFAITAVTEVRTVTIPLRIVPVLLDRDVTWERIGRVLAQRMAMRKEMREKEFLLDSALARYRNFARRYPELLDVVPQRQIANFIGITEQALSRILRSERDA